jgi:hypothetical protein
MASLITRVNRHKIPPFAQRAVVPALEYSPWVPVNDGCTVVLSPNAGASGKVQATCSTTDLVAADNATNATNGAGQCIAFDWVSGVVTTTTAEQLGRATAVRFVSSAGIVTGEVAS